MDDFFGRNSALSLLAYPLLFVFLFLLYSSSDHSTISDSLWSPHISASLLTEGNLDLDEFSENVAAFNEYGTGRSQKNGRLYPRFPIGAPVITTPLIWLIAQFDPVLEDQTLHSYLIETAAADANVRRYQIVTASITIALAAVFMLAVARTQLPLPTALFATLAFALGTSAYSIGTRAIWQHTPSILLLTMTVWALLRAEKNANYLFASGFLLGLAYVTRPTNALSVLIIGFYCLYRFRWQTWRYAAGGAVVAAAFFAYNLQIYGSIQPSYFSAARLRTEPSIFATALLGNLVSPAKGIVVFSPFIALVGWHFLRQPRRAERPPLSAFLWLIIVLHWLAVSNFRPWTGGFSFGPRFMSDVVPYIGFLLIVVLAELRQSRRKLAKPFTGGLVILILVSMLIHYRGATLPQTWYWSEFPVVFSIDRHRLWNWRDLQFMRSRSAMPVVALPARMWGTTARDGERDTTRFTITNISTQPVNWRVMLPQVLEGIESDRASYRVDNDDRRWMESREPLAPGADVGIRVFIPQETRQQGTTSGLEIITIGLDGEPRASLLLPFAWEREDKQDSVNIRLGYWASADITVAGQPATSDLFAVHGSGWYARESAAPYFWRWAQSPAVLHVYASRGCDASMMLALSELHDPLGENGRGTSGTLLVSSASAVHEQAVTKDVPVSVPVRLDYGWNKVELALASGNFRPNQVDPNSADARTLSFVVPSIDIDGCE